MFFGSSSALDMRIMSTCAAASPVTRKSILCKTHARQCAVQRHATSWWFSTGGGARSSALLNDQTAEVKVAVPHVANQKVGRLLEAAQRKRTKTPDNFLCHGGEGPVKHPN
jgi:hypothetical protein